MLRAWLALALLTCSAARGQAPSYSAANIVNAVSYAPGPFAPNSVVSIFGSNLAWDPGLFVNTSTTTLPQNLDSVSVYVDFKPAPLLMVSQGQINFLIPSDEIAGDALIQVSRQGVPGPRVTVSLVSAAPTLFPSTDGYVLAEDWNNAGAVIASDSPAHPGDTIILFVTGLGAVQVRGDVYDIASLATSISSPSSLKVLLDGTAVGPMYIKYAGLTPGWAGLYQINLLLPAGTGNDPAIQVTLAGQSSQPGLKLAVR
ncbi:MAG: hypothetical protein P4L56_07585 [Candidatus Sulfopaludibacter sp.]|nr:hypothetical protein [Candidatus Sulfopaludibacter sp.]